MQRLVKLLSPKLSSEAVKEGVAAKHSKDASGKGVVEFKQNKDTASDEGMPEFEIPEEFGTRGKVLGRIGNYFEFQIMNNDHIKVQKSKTLTSLTLEETFQADFHDVTAQHSKLKNDTCLNRHQNGVTATIAILATPYCSTTVPTQSPLNYLKRFHDHVFGISTEAYIFMIVNMRLYFQKNPLDWLNNYNLHRLMVVCLLSAHKVLDDGFIVNNLTFSIASGIRLEELQLLEIDFLNKMDYCVATDTLHYAKAFREVIKILSMLDNNFMSSIKEPVGFLRLVLEKDKATSPRQQSMEAPEELKPFKIR